MSPRRPPLDRLKAAVEKSAKHIIERELRQAASDEERERIIEASAEAIQQAISRTLEESAPKLADAFDRGTPALLRTRRRSLNGFHVRLYRTWKEGIDRLEALHHAFAEIGERYYQDGFHPQAGPPGAAFTVLSQLHARSCRVVGEVLCLMRGGFSDGALARWRTLHEIAIVAQFITKHGEPTAERYLLHERVRGAKAAGQLNSAVAVLGWEPIPADQLERLQKARDELIDRFGKAFATDFGWAAEVLNESCPGIGHLESNLDLKHWRPFYKWASDGVHAGPEGLRPMGLPDHGDGYLLSGPSNAGLADPGQNIALSMSQILAALVQHRPSIDYLPMISAFSILVGRAQEALMTAHWSVEERTAENVIKRTKMRAREGQPGKSSSKCDG